MGDEGGTIILVLPGLLPQHVSHFIVAASPNQIQIMNQDEKIAEIPYNNPRAFECFKSSSEIGIIEYPKGEAFPGAITALAYVRTREYAL